MPLQKTPGRQRNRHRSEYHADQRRNIQKLFRTLQRRADFRTRVAYAFDALARLQLRGEPVAIAVYRFSAAGNLQAIAYAAAGLHQPGGSEIGLIHHHARPGIDEADGGIRLLRHHGSNS